MYISLCSHCRAEEAACYISAQRQHCSFTSFTKCEQLTSSRAFETENSNLKTNLHALCGKFAMFLNATSPVNYTLSQPRIVLIASSSTTVGALPGINM